MKIEIKSEKRGTKDYYDELLYVAKKHDELLKNPNKKIYRVTKYICFIGIISLCILIFGIISFILDQSIINMLLIVMPIVLILLTINSYFQYKKLINDYINSKGNSLFEMDKDGVKTKRIIDNSELKFEVKWENVKHIIISKYSICFINDDRLAPVLSSDIINKNKIVDGLKKLKKDNLIVKNKFYNGD